MPDQASGFLDLGARNPAGRLDDLRRIATAQPRVQLERRMAEDFALSGRHSVFTVERQVSAVPVETAGGGVVRHQAPCRAIPGERAARIAARLEVVLGQQAARVRADQVRPVAPGADEVAVVPAALDHHVGEAEGEGAVRAGPHPEPHVRLAGEPDMARVDDDQPHAALERRHRRGRVGEAGEARVVTPQDQHAGVRDIRHGPAAGAGADAGHSVREASGETAPPAAEVERDGRVRGAERVRQPLDEAGGISDRGRGWRRDGEGDSLRTVPLRHSPHRGGGQVQRLVPADPFPARVGIALGASPAERMEEPL